MLTITLLNFWRLFFVLENDRIIFNLKLFTSNAGAGLASYNQTVRFLLRTPGQQNRPANVVFVTPITHFYVLFVLNLVIYKLANSP
jgi:hypothetical protein